jgi:hypothetical protein
MSTFTIVYNGNNNTGGTVPTDPNVYSTDPNASNGFATVLAPDSSFVNGSDTWARWNTEADGTGDEYGHPGPINVFSSIPGVVTLYAQWYTINGLSNGGKSSPDGVFTFVYERCLAGSALGNIEPARTNTFLKTIENDYQTLSKWFGGVKINYSTPILCQICNLSGGAWWGPPIQFKSNGLDSTGLRYLFYSEVSEMLMDAQGKAWYDGSDEQSCGEALSRFCGTQLLESIGLQLSNPSYIGYQTSMTWLNSSLPTSNPSSTMLSGSIGQLISAITATSTSITLSGNFSVPYETTYAIQIDNEQIQVTGSTAQGSNEILTVTRGYNNTTAVSHAVNASVSFSYGSRADYVNTTLEYDIGIDASVGCSTLFIYYLNVNLGFTVDQICQAAPPKSNGTNNCLRGVYQNLTGDSSDPFPFFKSLLDDAFPPDQTFNSAGMTNPDNPFPLGSLTFYGTKNTWGKDEVSDLITQGGDYSNAFWLMLSGFNQSVVGSAVPSLPSIPFNGASANTSGIPIYETSNQKVPQQIRFPYDVQFTEAAKASFPSTGEDTVTVTSQIPILGVNFPAQDDFYFNAAADPYFINVIQTSNPADENAPYLSADIRVFTATPALNSSPVPGVTPFTTDDNQGAYAYLKGVLQYLNDNFGDPTQIDPFAANSNVIENEQYATNGDSSVTQYTYVDNTQYNNYNFAIARVRLSGTQGSVGEASGVKVFFRVWGTQDADTEWDPTPTGTYAHVVDSSGNILGPAEPPSGHTIPFFGTESPNLQDSSNAEFGPGGLNNKNIVINQGDSQWTYFGAFLDVFNPSLQVNGQQPFPGTHHCLVCEINDVDAPIQTPTDGSVITPESSSQLAQRNMQITTSDNPGGPAAHRVPQTFSINYTPTGTPIVDQLMIDWGDVPEGSTASFYWPQIQADDIINLSSTIYGNHPLSVADTSTIQCKTVKGTTYIPIPVNPNSEGDKFIAGLFTIDLPTTVVSGQQFNVVVRKLRARTLQAPTRPPPAPQITKSEKKLQLKVATPSAPGYSVAVIGSFNVRIPVSRGELLLRAESDTLAIMKARLAATPTTSIWYPVLKRYVGYLSGRVDGFGGSASAIPPSLGGAPIPLPGPGQGKGNKICFCGKISGICYNGAGDFDGFLLEVEQCKAGHEHPCEHLKPDCCQKKGVHEHRFHSTKEHIYKLVDRAWRHSVPITVCVLVEKPDEIDTLVLRGPV